MKMRKVLTAALAAAMLFTTVPPQSFAAGGDSTGEQGKLIMNKTATLTDDGSYTINMEAFATGKTTTQTIEKGVPLDIVLVLDRSGSMNEKLSKHDQKTKLEALTAAATGFVNNVYANGKKHGVEHRIGISTFAGHANEKPYDGEDLSYVNSGIFDKNGTFVGYESLETGAVTYVPYDGTLDPSGEYYVDANGKYVQLTWTPGGDSYVKVDNPDTSKQDHYYGSATGGDFANYGEYTETTKTHVKDPVEGTEGYVDANSNPLTWKTITVPGETTYEPIKGTIQSNKEYYIYKNNNYLKVWQHGKNGDWRDETQKNNSKAHYKASGTQFTFVKGDGTQGKSFSAYEKVTTTKTVLTTSDGKEYTGKVYTQATTTKTGWNVNGTPVKTLYELQKGAGKWQYQNGKETVDYAGQPVFVKSSSASSVYAEALVPVSMGSNGSGKQRPTINNAINSITANGPTRVALGVEMGNKIFAAHPLTEADKAAGRQRIMIIFTDGAPGYSGYEQGEADATLQEVSKTKGQYGAKVYTIGLYKDQDTNRDQFMNELSSNYGPAQKVSQQVTGSLDNHNKNYYIEKNGTRFPLTFGDVTINGSEKEDCWYYEENGEPVERTTEVVYETVTTAVKNPDQKYYHQVTDAAALDDVFQSIQEDISGSTTAVDLTTTSILRDIMAEGFELTANSVVTVKVVPGDATNAADPSGIKWGTPVTVCQLTDPTNGKSVTGTYTDTHNPAHTMNLKASVYMKNPESGKKNLHTVDVTGFDYKDQYIAKAHKGSKLMVEITGIQVLPTVATNQNLFTNHDQSGIWAPLTEGGKRELKAPFPQRPETYIPSKSFVMDYAKPTQLTASDFDVASKNLDKNGYVPFASANTAIAQTYGNAALAGGKLTYSPKTTNWDGYDTFYVFGTTNDKTVKAASANSNGNVWAKVNVIPANNVYYEDTFVTDGSTDTVGIYYTGAWTEVPAGPNSGAVEDSSNPNDNQGWIPVLKGEAGDTDGTSHGIDKSQIGQLTGKGSKVASASFAFTGTGVDVYSRTNGQTGMILAYLKDASGKAINVQIIDTLSASGEYYNVPTLSLYQDGKGVDLPYGKYTLELYVTTQVQDRYEYYLDGIRIYNPLGHGSDDVVNNAYGPDEQNATFIEVRDKLLDANSFSGDSTKVNGFVFIDQILEGQGDPTDKPGTSTSTTVVGTYKDYGPKNEVYLAPFQSVTFKVNQTPGNHYFVGLKSPTGAAAMASYPGADGTMQMDSISHTGDMYYEVAPTSDGFITISNDSRGTELLAITKLKVTNPNAPVAAAAVFAETDTPALLMATQTFMAQTPDPDVDPDFDRITIHDIFHSGYNPQEIRALLKDLLEQLFAQIEADLSSRVPTISEIISGDFSKLEGLFGHIGSWHPHW